MEHHDHNMVEGESSLKEYFKFALVILVILAGSLVLAHSNAPATQQNWMRLFMGLFFTVFGVFKLLGYSMFVLMFPVYDIVAKRFKAYSYAYPFIELMLGVIYLSNFLPSSREYLTLAVMGVGSIGVWQELKKRSGIHCACLGNIIKLPLSTVSLIEDAGMGLMALVTIWLV